MTQTTRELSIDIMRHIQRTLNNIIETQGEIKINNKTIWQGYLHQMDNHVWRGILETLNQLSEQSPQLFSQYHLLAIEQGLAALDRFDMYYDNVLDMKNHHLNHKKIAWKCLMTVREIMNTAHDIRLPNCDTSRVKTNLGDLFSD